eukprot:UN33646
MLFDFFLDPCFLSPVPSLQHKSSLISANLIAGKKNPGIPKSFRNFSCGPVYCESIRRARFSLPPACLLPHPPCLLPLLLAKTTNPSIKVGNQKEA